MDGGGEGMEEESHGDEDCVCCTPFDGTGRGLIDSNSTVLFDFVFDCVAVSSAFETVLLSWEGRGDCTNAATGAGRTENAAGGEKKNISSSEDISLPFCALEAELRSKTTLQRTNCSALSVAEKKWNVCV